MGSGNTVCHDGPAGAGAHRTVDGGRHVPCYGDDLLAPRDRGGAGASRGSMIGGRALWPCGVTFRPIVPQLTCITNIRSEPYLAKKLASDKQVMLCPSLLV